MKRWFEYTKPRLENVAKKWKEINISNASNQTLLDGITEMGIEEGNYWSDDSSHTFGVAKSTDDQFNTFLKQFCLTTTLQVGNSYQESIQKVCRQTQIYSKLPS